MVVTILQEYRRMKGKLQSRRAEKEMFKKAVEYMINEAVENPEEPSETAHRILNSVRSQIVSVAMRNSRLAPAWSEKQVSAQHHYSSGNGPMWRDRSVSMATCSTKSLL